MTQPDKSDSGAKSEFVGAAVSKRMHRAIRALAEAHGRSLSAEIRIAIEEHLRIAALDETGVPIPSDSWKYCRRCGPRQACPQHSAEAEAYYAAVHAQRVAREKQRLEAG